MKDRFIRPAWAGALACAALAGCATEPAPPSQADAGVCFRPECCDRTRSLSFEPHRLNCEAIRLRDGGKPVEAEKKIATAIAAAKRSAPEDHAAATEVLCFATNDAAEYRSQRGDNDGALAMARENVAYCRQRFGEQSIEAAQALYGQANLHLKRNELAEAEPLLKSVLGIARRQGNQTLVSFALDASGRLADMRGDRAEGRALLNQALELKTALFGEYSIEVATTCTNLGASYMEAGADVDGWPWYRRAATIYAEELGTLHPRYLDVQEGLATSYLQSGRLDEAEAIYRDLLPALAASYGKHHEHYLSALNDYGVLAFRRENYALALERFSFVLAARRKAAPNAIAHGWTALNAAKAKMHLRGCASAKPYRGEARAVLAALRRRSAPAGLDDYAQALREFEHECRPTQVGRS